MDLPTDFWQLPAIAVVLSLVIGWLLWNQREERKGQQAERAEMSAYLRTLLQDAEAQRRQDLATFATIMEKNNLVQERTVDSIGTLTKALTEEMVRHEERAQRRFEDCQRQADVRCRAAVTQLQAGRPAAGG